MLLAFQVGVLHHYGGEWLPRSSRWTVLSAEAILGHGAAEAAFRAATEWPERYQVQIPAIRAGTVRQRQILRAWLRTDRGFFLSNEFFSARDLYQFNSFFSLHGTPQKRGFLRSVGDRWNNPPTISGAFFQHSASDALDKKRWSEEDGLGCRTWRGLGVNG